jgi:ring-1,2-phenylacetyl-CoA epoxidase subunit PaaE
VHDVRPGDEIEVLPPSGTFTADTPALSLAATVLRDGRSTVTVFYGNRRASIVMFADELADLKDTYGPRLQLAHVLSREPRDAELTSGRLDAPRLRILVGHLIDADHVDHWWLCGPHVMVSDARDVLTELSVVPERVHQELFYVDDIPPQPVRGMRPRPTARPARSPSSLTAAPPPWRCPGTRPCLTRRSRSAPICRSPARAVSAEPAGPR